VEEPSFTSICWPLAEKIFTGPEIARMREPPAIVAAASIPLTSRAEPARLPIPSQWITCSRALRGWW
jgi:hypothetical protein